MIGVVASLPRNADVAEQFDLLADLLELEGAESFRVLAYRRAATRMRETSGSVAQLALEGKAKELPGIGKTIEEKIVQIVETGEIEALAKKKAGVPPEVVLFMRLPGLGPKTAARIWKELGITTLAELKAAAEGERLRNLAGLGPKSEEKILKALAFQAENPDTDRRLLGEGLPAVQAAVAELRAHPAAVHVSEAGSVRRRKETFRDLDVIATATDPASLTAFFTELPWVQDVAAHGDTKATVVSAEGLRFDLRVVPPESYGNLLQHFTGSKEHNVAMREDAVRRGLSISEYGVTTVETGDVFRTEDEDALYEFLGYQPIVPELREDNGELEAARRGELPQLVELGQVRGDLHTHTHWSADGKSTLEEMVEAAIARGYAYYAITDHSHYLRDGRMAAQLEEIEQVRARYPKLKILAGVEANIRTNGEVDVPEDDLARLDWVVASVHQAQETRPTERVLEAMDNPYVDCIGHLTGRRIRTRGPRDVDVETRAGEGGRDRRLPRDQRSAGPARPLRRPRARGEGGGREARRQLGRAPDACAGLRRVRGRAGAARVADEGRRAEHAHVDAAPEATAEAAVTGFREDGYAAVDWAAAYRERVGKLPVLAQVSPGELSARLPASAPEQGEPFANILRDLDELIVPAMTNWQHPRFFAYFAITASQPGILAELLSATLNPVALHWRASPASTELELRVVDWVRQLLGLPDGWHGHIEDTASTSTLAALVAARHATGRNVLVCSEHAHSAAEKAARLLGMEVRKVGVDDELRMLVDGYELDDVAVVVAAVGTTSFASVDPVRALAERAHAAGAWLHVDAAYAGSAWILEEQRWSLGRRRARGLRRRERAQVAADADGLLVALDVAAGRVPAGVQPRAGVPAHAGGRLRAVGVRAGARPPLPLAEAVGGAALLRP